MVKDDFNKISHIKWQKIVERKNSLLFLSLILNGTSDFYTKNFLGYNLGCDYLIYLDGELFIGDISMLKTENNLKRLLKVERVSFFDKLFKIWKAAGNNLIQKASSLGNAKGNTNSDLIILFNNAKDAFYFLSTSLIIPLVIEKILQDNIKSILTKKGSINIGNDLLIITASKTKNDNEKETVSFEKIVKYVIDNKKSLTMTENDVLAMVDKHISKFGWLKGERHFGNPWKRKDIIDRLKNRINNKNIINLQSVKDALIRKRAVMSQFNKKEISLVEIAKKYSFLRTFRINTFEKAGCLIRPLLLKISKNIKIDFKDIIFLTPEEILYCLKKEGVDDGLKKKVRERSLKYGYYRIKSKSKIISGEEFKKFNREYFSIFKQPKTDETVKIIKGVNAFKGVVRGTVSVVKSVNEINKVKYGHILVAPMTLPTFISAMEKASAFITDEGGILCHAAITAREMKKPCIIGTKIATKILKDGDWVEVDAEKGIVKIIK